MPASRSNNLSTITDIEVDDVNIADRRGGGDMIYGVNGSSNVNIDLGTNIKVRSAATAPKVGSFWYCDVVNS